MGAGIVTASGISGSLDAKNIVLGVLEKAIEISNLQEIAIGVDVPELTATIPIATYGSGKTGVGEWENTVVDGAAFANVDFSLDKDRIKIGRSDEAKYKSRAGDPLALQKAGSAMVLANMLDTRIVNALLTSPQTGATSAIWSTVTNNPMQDFAKAVAAIRPYKADYCIMPSAVWAKFVGNDYTGKYATGSTAEMGKAITTIPGLGLKVYINENVTAKACLVGCSGAPSVAVGNGPVVVREEDSMSGGVVYQVDVFRQAKAPILKTAGNLNMGAYLLTAVIA